MKFLVIQTSFIGDVIAATALIEKLHLHFPGDTIELLVRQGNEELFQGHPFLNRILIWKKKENKFIHLFRLIKEIRKEKYDVVINLHRFLSTGIITAFSGAKETRGFQKNPLSFLFTKTFPHHLGDGTTEYERNQLLIADLTDGKPAKPRLYIAPPPPKGGIINSPVDTEDGISVSPLPPLGGGGASYICIAPASVWFTKQLPSEKWIELIQRIPENIKVYLLGSKNDFDYAEEIKTKSSHANVENLSGKLTLLQSAALMAGAIMNYVNDSAPLHLCSAMNAPVTAFFLSTITKFGFVPVSDNSLIVETKEKLDCRPCGVHGYKKCPQGHFRCAWSIDMKQVEIPHG